MIPINGNLTATVQKRQTVKNSIGEGITSWSDIGTVLGWLDYASGQNDTDKFKGKVQDTTHLFFCDYDKWLPGIRSEDCRLVIEGDVYNILLIDDPMGMRQHLEVYLKYIGGGLGV